MTIGTPSNSLKEEQNITKQLKAGLVVAVIMGCSSGVAAACDNNTDLPDLLVCSNIDATTRIKNDDLAVILGGLLGGGLLGGGAYIGLKRRKMKGTSDRVESKDDPETPSGEGVNGETIITKLDFPSPPFAMTWYELDAICSDIVSEVVGKRDATSELIDNEYLQQSARAWINESETKTSLGSLVNAGDVHVDIHNLLTLIKNPQYQQKIGGLFYYYLYHIPLVRKYDKFFEGCLNGLKEKGSKYLVGLNNEYDTEMNNYNLSEDHLQSLKDRWKSIIEDTNNDD